MSQMNAVRTAVPKKFNNGKDLKEFKSQYVATFLATRAALNMNKINEGEFEHPVEEAFELADLAWKDVQKSQS